MILPNAPHARWQGLITVHQNSWAALLPDSELAYISHLTLQLGLQLDEYEWK